MTKVMKYAAAIVTAAGCMGASALLTGCGTDRQKKVLSPEETVEAFTRHIVAGEFDKARSLCDTVMMKDYIDGWMQTWEKLQQKDSSALVIASSFLAGADITIERSEKSDAGKDVYYCIETEGQSKKRMAKVRKEEGEWRVETITDVI